MHNTKFDDKQRMTDALAAQKAMTGGYNTTANECASMALKNEMMNLLADEHRLQHDIFNEMQKRGWYATTEAPRQKIDKARQQYGAQQ